MAFANEFERLRQTMEQSRSTKTDPKDAHVGQDAEDEQIFTSSIKQLWQQAVNMHKQTTESDEQNEHEEQDKVKEEMKEKAMDTAEKQDPEDSALEDPDTPTEEHLNDEDPQSWPEFPHDDFIQESNPENIAEHDAVEMDKVEEGQEDQGMSNEQVNIEQDQVPDLNDGSNPFNQTENASALMEEIAVSTEVLDQVVPEVAISPVSFNIVEEDKGDSVWEEPVLIRSDVDSEELLSTVDSLAQISFEQLKEEMDQLLDSIYSFYRDQLKNLFGAEVIEVDTLQIQESTFANHLQAISDVVVKHQGKITEEARQAVHFIFPVLWKSIREESYRVPEEWYKTHLGFLCQYIKSGVQNQKFDPIDLQQAATLLQMSEKEVIKIYPRLGGVKLGQGYVFSRQKVEDYKAENGETHIPVTIENLQEYYRNTKECLTKLMKISQFMNESYDEIRYIRDLLLTGVDFNHNRIKQPIKVRIEQRLSQVYRNYQEVRVFDFAEIEVAQNEQALYAIPQIFSSFEQFSGETMTGDLLADMLEEMIKLIDDERAKINELTIGLTKNLGQLNIEIELLKIKQAL